MIINVKTINNTVIFAAEELKKYIKMMCPDFHSEIVFHKQRGIQLGLMEDLGVYDDIVGDKTLDDIIYIDTNGEQGIISGNNPRSVLLAVYEYLRKQGCRWLFPGRDGEYIPVLDKLEDIKITHKASVRFRGQCIEGAVSRENVLNAIDYAPKVGLNCFMLECFTPYGYYQNWYSHMNNDLKKSEKITEETALQWKRECEAEIGKRGLLYNDMGHGFTTLAFGVNELEDLSNYKDLEYLAMINGERIFFKNEPIETNFCMSNEKARKKFVDYIANYATVHSNVDLLHIWLADGINNHCECEECAKLSPSDWYLVILNELDAELCARGLDTKLVFVVYCDLLWSPTEIEFHNPDRFVMLFAPIARDYTINYGIQPNESAVTPYVRNKLENPKDMAANLGYLKKWQDAFNGSCFAYEYHFYFLSYFDLTGISLAKCAYDDVLGMKTNGIHGMIEDQSQRCCFPNNLPIYTWARIMWDENNGLEFISREYYEAAYGVDWERVYAYLAESAEILSFEYMIKQLKDKKELKNDEIYHRLGRLLEISEELSVLCQTKFDGGKRCQSIAWQLLEFWSKMMKFFVPYMKSITSNEISAALRNLDILLKYLYANESFLQNYFDVFLFGLRMKVALRNREKNWIYIKYLLVIYTQVIRKEYTIYIFCEF